MTRTYLASDFPLAPIDRTGRPVSAGIGARIVSLPDMDFHGFDALWRSRYAALENKVLPIDHLDENGYAVFVLWYTDSDGVVGRMEESVDVDEADVCSFCFDPRDIEIV